MKKAFSFFLVLSIIVGLLSFQSLGNYNSGLKIGAWVGTQRQNQQLRVFRNFRVESLILSTSLLTGQLIFLGKTLCRRCL